MKRFSVIFVVLTLCLSLCACGAPVPGYDSKLYTTDPLFESVERYTDCTIYRHRETNVLYVYAGSGMTVLFNADGTPMIWDGR